MSLDKNLTTTQLENVVFDGAVAYVNYGEASSRMIAPLKEGAKVEITQTRYEITRDGAISPEKGLVRIVEERAKATIQVIGMLLEDLRMALAGTTSTLDGSDVATITSGDGSIAATEYFTNITIIGETLNGDWKKVTIYSPLGGEGLNIETKTKAEAVLEIVVQGHKDPTNSATPLYLIENASAVDIYNITFQTGQASAIVYFNDKCQIADSDGNTVFYNVADDTEDSFVAAKSGYVTHSSTISLDGANSTISFALSAV